MDRKTLNSLTEISRLRTELQDLKATQPSGADNLVLRTFGTLDAYDRSYVITAGNRESAFVEFNYAAFLKAWQPSAYCEIYPQFWVNDLSTPYEGYAMGTLGIVDIQKLDSYDNSQLYWQAINPSGSTHTLYVKYYCVTTALGGSLNL